MKKRREEWMEKGEERRRRAGRKGGHCLHIKIYNQPQEDVEISGV